MNAASGKHGKILVVDDDRGTRDLLDKALSGRGYEVIPAANGLKLISTLEVDRPALVVLDVMLSWIDGLELCRSIKQHTDFRAIPVVMISARARSSDVQAGLNAGADAYFTKPLDLPRLYETIDNLIANNGSTPEG